MAEIRSGGPSWWSLLAVVMGIGTIGWLVFSATNKTDTETFTKGASKVENTRNVAPVIHSYPLSCSRFIIQDTPDGLVYADPAKQKVKK